MTTTPDPRQAVGLDNPPWPPYAPPHATRGRWSLPVAIVIAAIIVSATAIAIALITHSSTPAPAPAAPAPSVTAAATADANSSTCTAWRGAKAALDQSLGLPDGWDWTTPGIDQAIAGRNAVIGKTMDLFEPQIADQPAGLAKVAHAYVVARRNEMQLLAAHTYTSADGVAGTAGYHQLNTLCGIGN